MGWSSLIKLLSLSHFDLVLRSDNPTKPRNRKSMLGAFRSMTKRVHFVVDGFVVVVVVVVDVLVDPFLSGRCC